MKKIFIYLLTTMVVIQMVSAFSFEFNVFGYTISYQPVKEQEIIIPQQRKDDFITQKPVYEIIRDTPTQVHQFDEEINQLNNIKEAQLILKELDYKRIEMVDTDTYNIYTIFVNDDGTIQQVDSGSIQPEVSISGSLNKIREYVNTGDFGAIKKEIQVPFIVKVRLVWYHLFD